MNKKRHYGIFILSAIELISEIAKRNNLNIILLIILLLSCGGVYYE